MSKPNQPNCDSPTASRQRSEQYYRERAREIQELAARTPHADVRRDLHVLSSRYEHLAQHAKTIAEKASHWLSRVAVFDDQSPGDTAEAPQPE